MQMINDDYLYALMEQGQEAKAITGCTSCCEDLYEGQDVARDWEGNYFCDESCACEYHKMKNTFIDMGMMEMCEYCGANIYEDEDAVMDDEGNYYCDRGCFEYDKQIEIEIL